jgi:hypothetical protein
MYVFEISWMCVSHSENSTTAPNINTYQCLWAAINTL